MNPRWPTLRLTIAAVALLLGAADSIRGQPPPPAKLPPVAGKLEYVGPDTFILLDKQGRPQPVLGITYDEFVESWKQQEGVATAIAAPRFTIESLDLHGKSLADHVEMTADVTIKARSGGRLQVPLGLADAILSAEPSLTIAKDSSLEGAAATEGDHTDEADKSFIDYDSAAGGFVAWLAAQPSAEYRVRLTFVRPLVQNGNEVSLSLNLPRALVSQLSLTTPASTSDAMASAGTLTSTTTAEGMQLHVEGARGDVRVTWSLPATERPELAKVLSATGAISISIDGHSIRSDARLAVRSYGGSFDRFRVRLPPGAQLINDRSAESAAAASGYRIVADPAPASANAAQVVAIELAEKQLGPIEIALSTEQPLGLPSEERAVELGGFEVLGALRQYGDVAIQVADDWQLRWENGPYVRQVERADLPLALRSVASTVAFEYDRQPWSLRASMVARPMVVHAEPAYQLQVNANDASLAAELSYQTPGARAFEFRVRLSGWELTPDPIESNGLVDRDRVLVTREGVLILPLAQASSRRVDVRFKLRRSTSRDAAVVTLPLPAPEADTVAPADVVVTADDAIELSPVLASIRGMSPTPITSESELPASQAAGQVFQFRAYEPNAVFVAARTLRPRIATADVATALAIGGKQWRAAQSLSYRIAHQPVSELLFDVPGDWEIDGGKVEILSNGASLPPVSVSATTEPPAEPGQPRRARVALPVPRLGAFQVRVNYLAAEDVGGLNNGARSLVLPEPADVQITSQRVEISAPPEFSLALDESTNSPWKAASPNQQRPELVLTQVGAIAELPLQISPAALDRGQVPTVTRVWLQTWIAGGTIQDRAAIHFRTQGKRVTVELPPLATSQEVEVLADGALAQVSTQQEGRLIVELPRHPIADQTTPADEHTLELRYRHPAPLGLITRHRLTPPQLVGNSSLSEVYWQVVMPGDCHLIDSPSQLAPADPAQWLEVLWGRTPSKSQAELEDWSGATSQAGPTGTQNAYLFSGLAPMSSVEMITVPRWLIVLASSSAVLLICAAWIYLPASQRGWVGLLLAIAVASLAIAFPAAAVLLGQAALLGVILSAVGIFLRKRLTRRPTIITPAPTTGSTNMQSRSSLRTDSYLGGSQLRSTSGTPTAPLPAADIHG